MKNNREISISTAGSRKATSWSQTKIMWSEFVEKLAVPVVGTETLSEYMSYKKAQQDDLKDVGGFVAGTLAGGRRKADAVTGRDVVTLDIDSVPAGGTDDVLNRVASLGCGYAVYSTRKHCAGAPRLRVLVPLDRTSTAEEYEPLARKIASLIGMEFCDPSTFEASRLMYFPSCSSDSAYVYAYEDLPFLSVDITLAMYSDWRDASEWAQVPGARDKYMSAIRKQGDPNAKKGVVGAFCRTYDVIRAMDELIPGEYTPCDTADDRYTYREGSTSGGAVVYGDGKFLFSHHATDPCSGRLVNSFDLVRLHKFGELDDTAVFGTPTVKLPSYTAMCELAVADAEVLDALNQEMYDRGADGAATAGSEAPESDGIDWLHLLEVAGNTGKPVKTVDNILIILEKDPQLRDKIAFDEFANRGLCLGALPWDTRDHRRQWSDNDDAGLRHYMEKVYGITGKDKVYDGVALCAFKHRINDVQQYLSALQWDGENRLDTILSDYLGADDNVYTRAVARKSLTAAVARAMVPGVKYDYMPIFAGPQGLGKSTFLRLLGKRWYSDSLQVFDGKEAAEMIQGTWLNELGELNGFSKAETNAVKQFLSRTEDIFREPYGRRTAAYPRRCVFFGTTNDSEFLRDHTGNRRFLPVDVGVNKPTKSIFTELDGNVDQIWAEAYLSWQLGEPLYLTGEAEQIAKAEQNGHRVSNVKEGIIRDFLNKPIPTDWERYTSNQRLMYWAGALKQEGVETTKRTKICAAEIWCECFGKDIGALKQNEARDINNALSTMDGWERHRSTQRFAYYGIQRGFVYISSI